MASQFLPVRAAEFTFEVEGFYSQADSTIYQVAPTIAAGDFWISKDGGGWVALTNTPTAITAGSVDTMVQFVLTATEMTADRVAVKWVDAAGAEWIAGSRTFYTTAVGADALARPGDAMTLEVDALDALALATDAGEELADRFLARSQDGGADSAPTVSDAIQSGGEVDVVDDVIEGLTTYGASKAVSKQGQGAADVS